MPKELLVTSRNGNFKIVIPTDAKVTFAPFSPPSRDGSFSRAYNPVGTLRIYQGSKDNIVALFTDVETFRDLSLPFSEQVAKEEGATIWKSDQDGYIREDKIQRTREWIEPALEAPKSKKKR